MVLAINKENLRKGDTMPKTTTYALSLFDIYLSSFLTTTVLKPRIIKEGNPCYVLLPR